MWHVNSSSHRLQLAYAWFMCAKRLQFLIWEKGHWKHYCADIEKKSAFFLADWVGLRKVLFLVVLFLVWFVVLFVHIRMMN